MAVDASPGTCTSEHAPALAQELAAGYLHPVNQNRAQRF